MHDQKRCGLLHSNIDLRAGAGGRPVAPVQADQRGAGGRQTGHRVRGVRGPAGGRISGVAGDAKQAGGSLRGEVGGAPVAIRAALAVGRRRDVDQVWVDCAQVVVTESERREFAGLAGFDQDVGGVRQFAQALRAVRAFEIEDERLFVGVEVEVLVGAFETRLVIDEGGAAAGVDALRRLDQGDVRAEVGEQASGERGAVIGEVEDADAVQRERIGCGHGVSLVSGARYQVSMLGRRPRRIGSGFSQAIRPRAIQRRVSAGSITPSFSCTEAALMPLPLR